MKNNINLPGNLYSKPLNLNDHTNNNKFNDYLTTINTTNLTGYNNINNKTKIFDTVIIENNLISKGMTTLSNLTITNSLNVNKIFSNNILQLSAQKIEITNTLNSNSLGEAALKINGGIYCEKDLNLRGSLLSISDFNYKKNINDLNYGLEFINSLNPIEFKYKKNDDSIHFGFIAQDIKKLLNNNIKNYSMHNDNIIEQLNYMEFIAPLCQSIKELNKKINDLENQIKTK